MRKHIKRISKNERFICMLAVIVILLLFASSVMFNNLLLEKMEISITLERASVPVFSAVAAVSAIWTTYYLLFFQMYRDKYPLRLIHSRNQLRMKIVFLLVISSLTIGIIVISIEGTFLPTFLFLFLSVVTIVSIFFEVYRVSKTLMVNTYIDEYCSGIRGKIESGVELPDKSAWKEVSDIFDESITKEEYLIAQNITDNLGDIFREFMNDSIALVSKGSNRDGVNALFSQIVDFNLMQLNECKNVKSESLIYHVVNQNYKNLKFCVDSSQYEWFKQYIESLNRLIFLLLKDNQEHLCDDITSIYERILKLLIEQGKEEWWEYLINEFFSMIRGLNFINGNNNLKYFIRIITAGFIKCIDEKNDDAFHFLLNTLSEFTHSINRIPMAFTDIKVYYAFIFNMLKNESISKVEAISDLIFSEDFHMTEDAYWLEFRFFCVGELKELKNALGLLKKIEQYHIQTVIDAVDFRGKYHGILFIPEFEKTVRNNINNSDSIEKVVENIKKLLNRCIIKDNIPAFIAFLSKIHECFGTTSKANKLAQEKLFDLYLWLVQRTSTLVNQQFLELTFNQIRESIESLDKNRAISSSFSITIIQGLADLTRSIDKQSGMVVNEIINLLFYFLAEESALNFVLNSVDAKKQLCRNLFNIGTNCIEENNEDGLRRVSNSLGWLAIFSIRRGDGDLTAYILGRAEELYNIASEMDVSQKTMTFLLTLFTTIGTYCCKDKSLKRFLDQIIVSLNGADIQRIKTAIRLRTSENDMWNALYENRTKDLSKSFIKAFSDHTKNR